MEFGQMTYPIRSYPTVYLDVGVLVFRFRATTENIVPTLLALERGLGYSYGG
jgi:hypothetical protein